MTFSLPPTLTICADDYGLTHGIDQAVLTLLTQGAIQATSCMTTAPRWHSESAPALNEWLQQQQIIQQTSVRAEIGLHFNLTEGFGKQARLSLSQVLKRSYLRAWDVHFLERSLKQQLDAFEDSLQRRPDFIDGHQHVHQFPQIREVLLKVLTQRYPDKRLWLRHTLPPRPTFQLGLKPWLLAALGGYTFRRQLKQQQWPTHASFLGVYNFTGDYAAHFQQWLALAQPHSLIMCHPSSQADPGDGIGAQRVVEYEFLSRLNQDSGSVAHSAQS